MLPDLFGGGPNRDQTIALAGLFQAVIVTQQLARQGRAEQSLLDTCARSVLITDALNAEAVFGGTNELMSGLLAIRNKMGNRLDAKDLELSRYMFALIKLQEALRKTGPVFERVRERLATLQQLKRDELGPDLYQDLASLYKDTISTLQPRIMVQGEEGYLGNPLVVNQVRTALLAGVRAAVLWDQVGGRRRHLVVKRRQYVMAAEGILGQLPGSN